MEYELQTMPETVCSSSSEVKQQRNSYEVIQSGQRKPPMPTFQSCGHESFAHTASARLSSNDRLC